MNLYASLRLCTKLRHVSITMLCIYTACTTQQSEVTCVRDVTMRHEITPTLGGGAKIKWWTTSLTAVLSQVLAVLRAIPLLVLLTCNYQIRSPPDLQLSDMHTPGTSASLSSSTTIATTVVNSATTSMSPFDSSTPSRKHKQNRKLAKEQEEASTELWQGVCDCFQDQTHQLFLTASSAGCFKTSVKNVTFMNF